MQIRKSVSFLALTLFFVAKSAISQYYDASPSLVFGIEGAKPVSTWNIYNSAGVGGTLKLRLPSGYYSDVIFSGTVMPFFGKTTNKRKYSGSITATALAGYRVYLNPLSDYSSFYIQADGGLILIGKSALNLGLGGSFGYLINDRLDLSIRALNALTNKPAQQVRFISLGIGYGLNLY